MFDKVSPKRNAVTTMDVYEIDKDTDDQAVIDYLKQGNTSFSIVRFHFGEAYLFAHIKEAADLEYIKKIADFIHGTNGNIFLYEATVLGYISKQSGITFKLSIDDDLEYERKEFGIDSFVAEQEPEDIIKLCNEINEIKPQFDMRTSLAVRLYRPESIEYDFAAKAEIMFKRVDGEVVKE